VVGEEGAGEDFVMRSLITWGTLYQILLGDQVKKNETGGACSTHERDEKCVQYFGW
jgi:hypothetical protein